MKEQKGIPLYVEDVIRFDQPRAATTGQQGGPTHSSRTRTPPGSIHRAGHSIKHHPEDVPYLTDAVPPQVARQQQRPRADVFEGADYGGQPPASTAVPLANGFSHPRNDPSTASKGPGTHTLSGVYRDIKAGSDVTL